MTTVGTSLPRVKAALIATLQGFAGLSGIVVTDDELINADQLQSAAGDYEVVYVGEATAPQIEPPAFGGAHITLDEEYDITVYVQCLKYGDVQAAADQRAAELLGQVFAALVPTASVLGLAPDGNTNVLWALPAGWKQHGGQFNSGDGHGSRFEVRVSVRARLTL